MVTPLYVQSAKLLAAEIKARAGKSQGDTEKKFEPIIFPTDGVPMDIPANKDGLKDWADKLKDFDPLLIYVGAHAGTRHAVLALGVPPERTRILYPGVDAEERGQAEAIARSTDCCLSLGVPLIAVIIGEGGSGGAIAIATANSVLMLEHAIYSVISPEGAASILWRDPARNKDAATALKITAQDLKKFGVIDEIIPEPLGGAQRLPVDAIRATREVLARVLASYHGLSGDVLRTQRREKFLGIGRSL